MKVTWINITTTTLNIVITTYCIPCKLLCQSNLSYVAVAELSNVCYCSIIIPMKVTWINVTTTLNIVITTYCIPCKYNTLWCQNNLSMLK